MKKIKQILQNQKKYLRDLFVILGIIMFAFLAEHILLQWNSFKNEKFEQTYSLERADEITNKWGQRTYSFNLDGRYISSAYLNFQSDTDIESEISIIYFDGYGNKEEKELTDTASHLLGKSAIPVNSRVQQFNIKISYEDAEVCDSVQFVNQIVFHWARFLLLVFGLSLGYMFVFHGDFWGKKPEWMYAVISIALGTVIILSAHHSFDSWDEQIHFHTAYTDSWIGNMVAYMNPAMANAEMRVPTGDTVEEEQWIGQWLNSVKDEVVLTSEKGRFIKYNERAYIPQIIGLGIGRKLGLSYVATVFLGKFFNLLFCTGVVACAIHYSKYGKRTLMCVGLLPTTVFLFSSFTYDAFVIALLMLGIALFVTEYLESCRINRKRVIISILAFTIGCFSKAVYIPFLALYWIFPKEKFNSKRQKYLFKIGILVLLLLMFASFVLPLLNNVSSGANVGDYRGGDTSQTSQFSMILGYPWTYAGILLKAISTTLAAYFIGPKVLANFAYRGIYDGIGYYVVLITMLLTFVTDFGMVEKTYDEQVKRKMNIMKVWTAVLLFGTASLVWTALYLDFTPVGSMVINGVSPRYYLPMIYPLSLLFMNQKIKCSMQQENYQKFIALLMLLGTGVTIYSLMLA